MNLTDAQVTILLTYVAPSIVVGAVAVLSALLTNWFAQRQQKAQWEKEERREDRARQLVAADRVDANRSDTGRKMREIYGDAIADLSILTLYRDGQAFGSAEYREQSGRSEKSLAIVIASFHDRTNPTFIELREAFLDKTSGRRSNIDQLMRILLELASTDPRTEFGMDKADLPSVQK